jgi:hypothetical protein
MYDSPIGAYWNLFKKPGTFKCLDEPLLLATFGSINTLEDFVVVGLPLPMFWKLSLPKRQRIMICSLFGVGFCVGISGIVRTYFTDKVLRRSYDTFWDSEALFISTVVELDIGLVSCSVLATTVRPVLIGIVCLGYIVRACSQTFL